MIGSTLLRVTSSAARGAPARGMSGIGIAGPPQRRIAFPVKVGYGAIMVGSACFYPLWVLINIKNYKGKGSD